MPNSQKHRGKHPEDEKNFAEQLIPILKNAVQDFSYLLNKEYPENAALKVVGDRYRLNQRQRQALLRVTCKDMDIEKRSLTMCSPEELGQKTIYIDGYNLLIIIESALSGAMIFKCRDHTYRDIASIHGTYKKVEETIPAIELIGKSLLELGVSETIWYLDAPVSNSGRLKTLIMEMAVQAGWKWEVHLVNNPDKELVEKGGILVTSDSWILDRATQWFNLGAYLIDHSIPHSRPFDICPS